MPERGVGAAGSGGRRLLALFADWAVAGLVTSIFVPLPVTVAVAGADPVASGEGVQFQLTALLVWVLLTVPPVALFGFTPGMAALGIRVGRLDGAERVGWWRALVRCALTFLLIPAAIRNADGRGLHDRATGTVVVRLR